MQDFILYLLKASALLGIFFLSYLLLLKRETSFVLNRKFLIGGIIASTILPLIYFTRTIFIEPAPLPANMLPININTSTAVLQESIDWWNFAGYTYLAVTGFFILRLIIQLASIFKIIFFSCKRYSEGLQFIETQVNQLPFSFFNYIVFNPEIHSEKDLHLILEHEKVHARQLHSADILIVNLISCFFWFNPFAWFYKKAVVQNLEFIADRETVKKTAEIKDYQHALVKVSIAELKPALTNHFYQSFIKKRILMLNKRSSTQSPAWKLSLLMPILLAFMLLFNVKTEAQILESEAAKTSKVKIEETEISITIDKQTSKEDLESLTNFLENRDIEIDLNNVTYNNKLLTSITFNFLDKTTGNKGMMKRDNPDGIQPFKFFKKSNGEIGVEEMTDKKAVFASSNKPASYTIQDLDPDPLYIINGKEYKAARLKNKYIAVESDFEILGSSEAVKRFGKKAKSGAVILPEAHILRDFNKRMKELDAQTTSFTGKYIMVGELGKPNFMTVKTSREPEKSMNVSFAATSSSNKPMVIVDGKKVKGTNWKEKTKPENVAQVYVLKGEKANQVYGKAGKNGVIVIETNEFDSTKAPANYKFIKMDTHSFTFESAGDIPAVNTKNSNIRFYSGENPLYVLNGDIQDKNFIAGGIKASNILKMNVLKGGDATEKYGKKAGNGVIEIYTKDYEGDTSSPVESKLWYFNSKYTDEALKDLRETIMNKLELDVKFSDLKRNKKGLITAIKVTAESAENNKASATFQNTEGIPNILIGFDKKDNLIISSNN